MIDLGNFSTLPYGGVSFVCAKCDVSWTGCAAAADCPRCGRGFDWNDPSAPPTPPDGWKDALECWLRIWHRACAELIRKPHSCRAMLVERTSYRRLRELMAERP